MSDVADVVVFDLADVLAQPTYLRLSKAYGSRSFFMFELIKWRFVFVDSVIPVIKIRSRGVIIKDYNGVLKRMVSTPLIKYLCALLVRAFFCLKLCNSVLVFTKLHNFFLHVLKYFLTKFP